ncbi:OLC1v1017263C1 [Oldenlandia corymbosa var. corymbosa]|uniref:OLC1v1017263C1 n=1 Tax=Oldenlandia corymbosa var. corymbosa TaxID=529605 RepID=A0AAV1E908_OLDCO|nr:OLC1v1017263C1 [Oldenlandia corymbosa var. corymbosa]
MMWDEWEDKGNNLEQQQQTEEESESGEESEGQEKGQQDEEEDSFLKFDFLSVLPQPTDYYRILEVDYDATEDVIRSNYIRLALKWHPDKQKDQDYATSRFQEINEAYQGVLVKEINKKWSLVKCSEYLCMRPLSFEVLYADIFSVKTHQKKKERTVSSVNDM